jgi:Glycosyl hydrolase family 115
VTIFHQDREAELICEEYTVGPAENFTGPTLVSSSQSKTVIIAGTVGKSDVINSLISSGKLDVSAIQGNWESFISQVIKSPLPGVDQALVIAGSDMRGTIYGLYDVSEQIGVSPWWWFADVPPKKANGVWALAAPKIQKSPSVKYRGIFINDEQPALTNWIKYVPARKELGMWSLTFVARITPLAYTDLDSIIISILTSLSFYSD